LAGKAVETSNTKILIVDDTETMRLFHKHALISHGYDVETADDGEEALEKVATFGPALVILDTLMPKMNGIECCRRIKSDYRAKHIKVVFVSSNDDYDMISKAFAAGCDDYVIKPVDRSELVLTVRDVLKFARKTVLVH
jgi:PleD family two-component response regulator